MQSPTLNVVSKPPLVVYCIISCKSRNSDKNVNYLVGVNVLQIP